MKFTEILFRLKVIYSAHLLSLFTSPEVRNLFCLFVPSLSFCHKQHDGTIFWTNLHLLRSCQFPSFQLLFWLLPS